MRGFLKVKKYIVFAVSFLIIYSLLQLISEMILTLWYTPYIANVRSLGVNSPQEIHLFQPIIIAFLSATIAYFIPAKLK